MTAVTRDDILAVLRSIPDPEMPISIVDLGIVEDVQVEPLAPGSAGGPNGGARRVVISILPTFIGCPALDVIRDEITKKVGAFEGVGAVEVEFINDPPWSVDRISEYGRASLRAHGVTVPEQSPSLSGKGSGGGSCAIADAPLAARIDRSTHLPASSLDGRRSAQLATLRTSAIACPFCGSNQTRLDSPFGPTRCRSIYYCESCRNSFEHMKRV